MRRFWPAATMTAAWSSHPSVSPRMLVSHPESGLTDTLPGTSALARLGGRDGHGVAGPRCVRLEVGLGGRVGIRPRLVGAQSCGVRLPLGLLGGVGRALRLL